jgi:hypothetical protein
MPNKGFGEYFSLISEQHNPEIKYEKVPHPEIRCICITVLLYVLNHHNNGIPEPMDNDKFLPLIFPKMHNNEEYTAKIDEKIAHTNIIVREVDGELERVIEYRPKALWFAYDPENGDMYKAVAAPTPIN